MAHSILIADTQSPLFQLGLQTKTGERFTFQSKEPNNHSSHLLPSIESFLKKNNTTIQDIDLFGIVKGPGSFTGIRIGLTTFRTFGFVTKKPCYGLNTLEILAGDSPEQEQDTLIMLGASKNCIYTQLFNKKKQPLNDPQYLPLKTALKYLKKDMCLMGSQLQWHKQTIHSYIDQQKDTINFVEKDNLSPEIIIDLTVIANKISPIESYETLKSLYLLNRKY